MRQDQYEKLQELTEKLTDVFLSEAAPEKWPGAATDPTSWDQQTRGDRYWMKKNAAATLTVLVKTTSLIGVIQRNSLDGAGGAEVPESEDAPDTLDAEIKAAEKEASKLLAQIQKKTAAATGRKVHGKD